MPRQFPAPPALWINRARELREVEQAGAGGRGRPGLAVVSGPAGTGKTALALHSLHRMRELFPDGQVYADLADTRGGPVDPAGVLGSWLRAFGLPAEAVPVGADQRGAWWRSLIADKAVAVLLDNAGSAEQVRALLPASESCLVVVTTRRRLGPLIGDGARFIQLHPLSVDDSARLLEAALGTDRISKESPQAREVATLCGGFPIALQAIAGRLAVHPRLRLSTAVDQLLAKAQRRSALSHDKETSVYAAFDATYAALPPKTRRVYRVVSGVVPGREFDVPAASAATGVAPAELAEHLKRLTATHLVEQASGDRYRIHDLVREHAEDKARTEDHDRAQVILRVTEHFLATAQLAARILTPHLRGGVYEFTTSPDPVATVTDHTSALAWLDTEHANLLATLRTAYDYRWWEAAWELAYWMWPTFRYHGYHDDRITVDRLAIDAASRLKDVVREARASRRLALAYQQHGDYPAASDLLYRCYDLFIDASDHYGVADTHDALAVLADAQNNPAAAILHGQLAQRSFVVLGYPRKAALSALLVAAALVRTGEVDQGLRTARQARDDLRATRQVDGFNAARADIVLAYVLIHSVGVRPTDQDALADATEVDHRLAEAHSSLERGESAMRELGSVPGQVLAYRGHAELAWTRGNIDQACRYLREAIQLADHQNDPIADTLRQELTHWVNPADHTTV